MARAARPGMGASPVWPAGLLAAAVCGIAMGFGVHALVAAAMGVVVWAAAGASRAGGGWRAAAAGVGWLLVLGVAWAIALPVLTPRGPISRQVSCVSNLKQLGLALAQYASDYDDHWPPGAEWCDDILLYTKGPSVYVCPPSHAEPCSYAYNERAVGPTPASPPEGAVVLFDSRAGWNLTGSIGDVVPRHNDGANLLFTDGHVKWSRADGLLRQQWGPDPRDGQGVTDGDR
jgi:prepilin-type processing-associated H-X9-DG protein